MYLQVSHGTADCDFAWPEGVYAGAFGVHSEIAARGMKVMSIEDQRWARRNIKTTQLLFPSWAMMQVKAAGKNDAWLVEDGQVKRRGIEQRIYRQ